MGWTTVTTTRAKFDIEEFYVVGKTNPIWDAKKRRWRQDNKARLCYIGSRALVEWCYIIT